MKPLPKSFLPVCLISSGLIAVAAAAFGFQAKEPLDAKETDAVITAITAGLLENSQFTHQKLDEQIAGRFLDRYLDTLDGGHMLFLQSDLDEFAGHRATLAKTTRQEGNSSLAHVIFKRYLERLDQRITFVTDLLKKEKFDFTTDESFSYDRKKAARPADTAAAQALWKQQLRYAYLQEKLAGKKDEEIVKALSRREERTAATMRKFDDGQVLEMYLEALAQTYDPHSDYMGAEQLKSFEIAMNLSLVGIGATLHSDDGFCKIMELVPGGPAARSSMIQVGDRIVGVAQKVGDEFTDLVDLPLSQAVDLIRGKKGTPVILNIIPADAVDDSVRKTITIIREEIKLEEQQAKAQIIDFPNGDSTQRIGVVDLPSFYAGEGFGKGSKASASVDVEKLLIKLKQENVTGIILDLRRNGGGSLQESIDLTGLFIPTGPVVQTRNPEDSVELGIDHNRKVAWDGPLVVLTSRFSASASEILAGALQDYGRAVIVGDSSTFGKGTVQTIVPLAKIMAQQGVVPGSDPGALKVTISKFYRPSGKSTQLEGVKADVVIPSLSDVPEIGESDLGNALPWDTIKEAAYQKSDRVDSALAKLRSRSDQRISADPDFTELKTDIERMRKLRDVKSVSLNEEIRRKEKDELKARRDAIQKARLARNEKPPAAYKITLKNVGLPGLGDPVKPDEEKKIEVPDPDSGEDDNLADAPAEDIILDEAKKILIDYVGLTQAKPEVSQR